VRDARCEEKGKMFWHFIHEARATGGRSGEARIGRVERQARALQSATSHRCHKGRDSALDHVLPSETTNAFV
jgi:hypothetical protein